MSHARNHGTTELSVNGTRVTKSDESAISLDEKFDLLSNSRRRAAISVLFEHERIEFGELVDRVAEIEYQLPIEEISSDERHTIYVSLQQSHKKRLERSGVVEEEHNSLKLGPNADEMREFLADTDVLPEEGGLRDKVASFF